MMKFRIIGIMWLVLTSGIAFGWSNKEHIQLTRIAIQQLIDDPNTPPAMKNWLRQAQPDTRDMVGERDWFMDHRVGGQVSVPKDAQGISYWATVPDALSASVPRDQLTAPFGVHERMLHFVDLELLNPSGQVRGYRHDLSGLPKLEDIPRDMADARWKKSGMLPFRVVDAYERLVESIKAGQLSENDGADNAVKWAGFLAHYLEDNTQPQHATVDYRSQSYFANRQAAPNVHSAMEYQLFDDRTGDLSDIRKTYWEAFVKALGVRDNPQVSDTDLWLATLQVSMDSYRTLPLIGLAAMSASGQGGAPEHPQGASGPLNLRKFFEFVGTLDGRPTSILEMKAHQTAWAVHRVEQVLRKAWDAAYQDAR